MEKTIIILRHWTTDRSGILLPEGKELATAVGKRIAALYPDIIWEVWSSPQQRAIDTAEFISEKINTAGRFVSKDIDLITSVHNIHIMLGLISKLVSELMERYVPPYLILVTHQPNIENLYRKLYKNPDEVSYCEGVIMNQDGSQFQRLKLEMN